MYSDEHLNVKYRRRDQDEIEFMLREMYEEFLRRKANDEGLDVILTKMSARREKEAVDTVIELLLDENPYGYKDPEFSALIDQEALEWESR